MSDPSGAASHRCPWCSAEVTGDPVTCPSCGAALRDATSDDIPGVTQIDPRASMRSAVSRRRTLPGWLGGEREEAAAPGGKVEPPSPEVVQEMLRLELAALDAELEAKAQQAAAERELAEADAAGATKPPSSPRDGDQAPSEPE